MSRMFGTDGVRGVANSELTVELAMDLGKAAAIVLAKDSPRPLLVIGRDTRGSGEMLESALIAGILSAGGDVIRAGIIPTPGIACLTRVYEADAGVVISASHNPFQFNGIKFFNAQGFKLDDALEDEIEALIRDGIKVTAEGSEIGRIIEPDEDPVQKYREYVMSTFDGRLDGLLLVIDCANGAASVAATEVFAGLGAQVVMIGCEPDGVNINDGCGSTHPEMLARMVVKMKADAGLAFDGDADRLIAVDEKGDLIDGDRLISILEKYMKDKGTLAENRVTVTQMSNIGFHRRAEELGIQVDVTDVGDRYVLESMLKTGSVLGGEQSGHILLLEHGTTGDGMVAALQLLQAFLHYGRPLSELAEEMKIYPQVLVNAKVKNENKDRWREDPEILDAIDNVEKTVKSEGRRGRVLIRKSGTEPLVRVMIEGEDEDEIRPLAEDLAEMIEQKLFME